MDFSTKCSVIEDVNRIPLDDERSQFFGEVLDVTEVFHKRAAVCDIVVP